MGRYYWDKKTEAEDTIKIQSWFLNQHGYFRNTQRGTITWSRNSVWDEYKSSVSIQSIMLQSDPEIRIIYTQTDQSTSEKKNFDYRIPLTTTSCNFGGLRYWFICPWYINGFYCGRRVGVLYKDGDYFACRHCYNLSYQSRNENRRSKLYYFGKLLDIDQKADKLNDQIKRRYYAGRSTKKQRQLEKLHSIQAYASAVISLQDGYNIYVETVN